MERGGKKGKKIHISEKVESQIIQWKRLSYGGAIQWTGSIVEIQEIRVAMGQDPVPKVSNGLIYNKGKHNNNNNFILIFSAKIFKSPAALYS